MQQLFISLAVILAVCALLITLKAVGRISRLEDEVSQLHKELAELRARWFEKGASPTFKPEQHDAPQSQHVPTPTENATQPKYFSGLMFWFNICSVWQKDIFWLFVCVTGV